MGVIKLWPILEETEQTVSLDDLRGQKVAIDLNGWILTMSKITNPYKKQRPGQKRYLQMLFWRCYHLLKHEIAPIFVIDGIKSSLKSKSHVKIDRSKSPAMKECKHLLNCLGLPWIVSAGEAEALCAKLDQDGQVNGCITDDNDAFLYGAKTVYRKFSCDKQKQKNMKAYYSSLLDNVLHLDRERLIVLALFLGCDYTEGIRNVGPKTALDFVCVSSSKTILDQIRSWREDPHHNFVKLEKIKKTKHCSRCNHEGDLVSHLKKGCSVCGTKKACCQTEGNECNCVYHCKERHLRNHELETRVRQWALQDPNFPSEEVINEYLTPKCEKIDGVESKRPNSQKLRKYLETVLKFKKIKAKEKANELVMFWDHINSDEKSDGNTHANMVKKMKIQKFAASSQKRKLCDLDEAEHAKKLKSELSF